MDVPGVLWYGTWAVGCLVAAGVLFSRYDPRDGFRRRGKRGR